MKSAIEQSIKEKIKALTKERESTFAELWKSDPGNIKSLCCAMGHDSIA